MKSIDNQPHTNVLPTLSFAPLRIKQWLLFRSKTHRFTSTASTVTRRNLISPLPQMTSSFRDERLRSTSDQSLLCATYGISVPLIRTQSDKVRTFPVALRMFVRSMRVAMMVNSSLCSLSGWVVNQQRESHSLRV